MAGSPARADDLPVHRFFGTYVGNTGTADTDDQSSRTLQVGIGPANNAAFTVSWQTVITNDDGRSRRREYSVAFSASGRAGLYQAAQRANMFGHMTPLDPMKGDPYVWAYVREQTLIIHAMVIVDDGTFEMQSHYRTLTPTGMELEFVRLGIDGIRRTVTASLTKQ